MSDYETAQRRRDIIVGIFVVAGVCALLWLIFKFGDLPTVVSKIGSFTVIVQFPTAPDVHPDTPVNFCGYQIGRVTDVMAPQMLKDRFTGHVYHQTKVVLRIEKKYANIPSNVKVKLMRRGLGSSFIELTVDPATLPAPPLDPNRPGTRFLVDGTLLQGSTGVTSEFFPAESQERLDKLVTNLCQLIENANIIVGDPNSQENFRAALANLPETTKQAEQMLKDIRKLAAATTETVKNTDARAEDLVIAMIDASEHLSETMSQLRVILEKMNSGEGTAGRFLNDGKLYESMVENAQQMQELMGEIESLTAELKAFVAKARKKGLKIKW
ncbi:MAG: MCE family protein [Candidatus Hydrogenedentota bacterium]|nr:MAG: MCE family protein [Candidatus Hydrogenedentota bacterium]